MNPHHARCLLLGILAATPLALTTVEGAPPDPAEVRASVTKGLSVLKEGTIRYPEQKSCFTCHHQTLPMLAQVTARDHGFSIDEDLLKQQAQLTHESFVDRKESLRAGKGIGGRSMTVGFACWALDLADWKHDETTEALAEFLLKTQHEDGSFFTNQSRPPLEDSPATSVVVASYYLQQLASENQQARVKPVVEQAKSWLIAHRPTRQEDRNSRLWGLHLLEAPGEKIAQAREEVLKTQREDGGWAQLPSMESDSYATGQALWMLQEAGHPTNTPAYERGMQFLLRTQRPDGSWFVKTRSKPIQKHFESGFPHGKDQFISICGTSWAVAALAAALPPRQP